MGHIGFITCSGYTKGEVSWMTNSGGMRTTCPCVSFFSSFSSSLQSLLRLIGSPSQTQGRSQECYLLVSHHIKGMSGYYSSCECVTDICCFLSQLPKAATVLSLIPGRLSESVRLREEEIMRPGFNRHSRAIWVVCYWHVTWWKYYSPTDPCGGSVLFDVLEGP